MHAAVDDRRKALHQPLVPSPSLAVRLLVEIHPEDERGAELARDLDELDPGRMLAKDIADHELALRALSRGDDLLGVGDAVGERLFDENIRTRLHRLDGEIGVRVRQRVDRDDVGLEFGERLLEVVERLRLGEFAAAASGRRSGARIRRRPQIPECAYKRGRGSSPYCRARPQELFWSSPFSFVAAPGGPRCGQAVDKCRRPAPASQNDPGPGGRARNMWKPVRQPRPMAPPRLHLSRATRPKARMGSLPAPVHGLEDVHHKR